MTTDTMTQSEYLDVTEATSAHEEAAATLEGVRKAHQQARTEAVRAQLACRDLDYLVQTHVLSGTDREVQAARSKAAPAVQALRRAEAELARAERAADLASRRLEAARAEQDRERRFAWVEATRPEVVAAWNEAREREAEYNQQMRDFPADPYSRDGARRMEIGKGVRARAAEAWKAVEAAMTWAPPAEGGQT